jgi:hypothetical protein
MRLDGSILARYESGDNRKTLVSSIALNYNVHVGLPLKYSIIVKKKDELCVGCAQQQISTSADAEILRRANHSCPTD